MVPGGPAIFDGTARNAGTHALLRAKMPSMVHLSRIYTKTGDDGTTSLGDGTRVPKTNSRIAAYGSADELGAAIGLAALLATGERLAALRRIQNDLFDVGADLCVPESPGEKPLERLRVTEAQVTRLEDEIDVINKDLSPLRSFVLSGGSPLGAHLHFARCVARRCERDVLALAEREHVNPIAVHYLNRLSDFLFVLARAANQDTPDGEILWKPGGNR